MCPKEEQNYAFETLAEGTLWSRALLVSSALLMAATNQAQFGPPNSASGNKASILLEQIRAQAVHVRYLADQLQAYERDPNLAWEADAGILTRMRDQVNAMDRTLYTLRTIEGQTLPWQQKAIDRITPKTYELTSYVEDATQNLNNNHETIYSLDRTYAEDADGIYHRAAFIARSIGDYEHYAAARTEIQQLSPELGIRAGS